MKQTTEEVISKIQVELRDLQGKLARLETFMTCPDFMEISHQQQSLLNQQYEAMSKYKDILIKRVYVLRDDQRYERIRMEEEAAE